MRGLNAAELDLVNGGSDAPYPGPSREEVERQIEQFLEMLEERERQRAIRGF
ncbi:hypothetical protein LJR143_002483 [Pseudoxanthomonas sp. LjRoot143]|uniref:hypothetical protein n=1 Tax=Pseudoxanthomonas sp. LjRoot143 TaxID=3342266 RepID=UPI003ED13CEF